MKKGTLTAIVVAAVVVILFFWVKNSYNSLVKADEQVSAAWAQVENVYQRRADLIPNLVATVKGYAEHESATLESVVAARAKATQMSVTDLDAASIEEYQAAQGELSQALGRLLMITENYPDLKASQNFRDLQAQLEGTENRIATERMKFNEASRTYNTMVRTFPKNIIASMFNFDAKGYFQAVEEAETAPEVQF